MTTPINIQTLLALKQTAQQYSSSESIYWKPTAGLHTVRVCPPWSAENSPTRMMVNHSEYKNKEGQLRMPLCYNYAFTERNIFEALKAKNVLKQLDAQVYGKIGCVYCRISEARIQMHGKKNNKTYARTRYAWNLLDRADGKVHVFNSGSGLLDAFTMMYSVWPRLMDINEGMDIMIQATGEKLQRRYTYNLITTPCPLGIELSALHDLDQVMADGYTPISDALDLIITSYPEMMQLLGLNQLALPSQG